MSLSSAHDNQSARTDLTMLDLFTEQVRVRPATIAIRSGKMDVSYSELDALSERIAAWLVEHDVGPEDVVAVEIERGHDLVATLIGILKAGAAYLALEPDTPRSWRDRLVTDAGALALVTRSGQHQCPGLSTLRLPEVLEELPVNLRPAARQTRPESLAYICYTSGSTGRPKGVGVPHRAVVRLASGHYAELGPNQTFLFVSPVSFDASTFEIWAPLLTGGTLVIYPPGPMVAEELAAVLREEKVTTLWLTAGFFHRMVDHNLDALGGLQQLLAGGDVLNPRHVTRFVDRFPEIRFINGYGPTENTTFTTCHTVLGSVRASSVPIGRPITGTTIHILDSNLMPVPSGTSGELWVSGLGLSQGYLGQPGTTAVSFVPNPFGTAGSRMYRTGDMVLQEPTGDLQFIGRVDRQVKIRGFRVEPADVEREISAIPGVREAVVSTQRDHLNEKSLIAYLVPDPDDEPEGLAARVRRGLRNTLPAPMIPAVFITMDQFPLTPNGKIDRAALPVTERTARDADTEFVAPRSPTERLLCDMWAELLNLYSVGIVDDFFELGGNSLVAMDLMRQIETVFDVELPTRALLYHPTVEEFAGAIEELVDRGRATV